MRINHNISALNTYNKLGANQLNASKNMEKLSSGLRINRAGDDAAGLAISEKMRAQIRGLDMATKNANDSISLIQTAEGALNETHSILQRMRELAVQATNDTNTDADRTELQAEINQLIAEVDRIGNTTEFNTKKLLDGTAKGVVEKRDGSGVVNNNSNLTITQDELQVFQEQAKDAQVNGSYTLIKTNETMSGTTTILEFKVYDNDGVESTIKLQAGGGSGTTDFKVSGGSFTFLSGSAVFASGTGNKAVSIDISGLANAAASGGLKVGESITFVFGAKQDAEADVNSAILTQIGANGGQTSFLSMNDMRSKALDIDQIDVTDKWSASAAIERVNAALTKVSAQRSSLGAVQNRLEHTINNLTTASENLSSAESRIRDVDMAKEMMELTKNNILSQASQAMLARNQQHHDGDKHVEIDPAAQQSDLRQGHGLVEFIRNRDGLRADDRAHAAHEELARQRDNERLKLEIVDHVPHQRAKRQADQQDQRDHDQRGPAKPQQKRGKHARKRNGRCNGNVDAARQQHKRYPDGSDHQIRVVVKQIEER